MSAISPNPALGYDPAADSRAGSQLGPGGLSKPAWIKIAVISLLLVAIFWPNLRRLWSKTNPLSDQPDAANWQHAIAVPLIGLFYLYANREKLLAAPVRSRTLGQSTGKYSDSKLKTIAWMFAVICVVPGILLFLLGFHHSALGLQALVVLALAFANAVLSLYVPSQPLGFLILVEGLAVAMYGIYPGHNDFVWDVGMVITVFGVVLMLAGWDVMKTAWFPIAFLLCALPWPGLVYSWVAGPLQTLAAKAAVVTLRFTGVEAFRSGTKMLLVEPGDMRPRILNVAEACAGLRSLMTFITIGAAIAFLSARPLWQKVIITLSAIPIAIFCNVMRVTGQGLLYHYVSHESAEGFAHQFVGVVMLIPAFFLILGVAWLLDNVFLDEVDDKDRLVVRAAARSRTAPAVAGAAPGASGASGSPAAASAPAAAAAPRVPAAVPRQPSAAPRSIAGRIGPAKPINPPPPQPRREQ